MTNLEQEKFENKSKVDDTPKQIKKECPYKDKLYKDCKDCEYGYIHIPFTKLFVC